MCSNQKRNSNKNCVTLIYPIGWLFIDKCILRELSEPLHSFLQSNLLAFVSVLLSSNGSCEIRMLYVRKKLNHELHKLHNF